MNYRLTCITPTLVGDGQKLAPIDYMVWKEHVNVLNQKRIFRLLAKGPRLEGYLSQLKKADKLDFASWGGFAQNYAGRRIPLSTPARLNIGNGPRPKVYLSRPSTTGPAGHTFPEQRSKERFEPVSCMVDSRRSFCRNSWITPKLKAGFRVTRLVHLKTRP